MKDKNVKNKVTHKKYERVYEFDDCTIVYKYDTSKTTSGPFETEIRPKKPKK